MSDISAKKTIRDLAVKAKQLVDDETLTQAEKAEGLDKLDVDLKSAQEEIKLYDRIRSYNPAVSDADPKPFEANDPKSIGEQLVATKEFKAAVDSVQIGSRFSKTIDLGGVMTKAANTVNEGAPSVVTGSAGQGGANVLPQFLPGVLPLLFQPLRVEALFASGATQSNAINYVVESAFNDNTASVAEAGPIPQDDLTFTRAQTSVTKISNRAKITDEMLQDYDAVQAYIQNRLAFGIDREVEKELLNGDGAGSNLKGILHQNGLTVTNPTTAGLTAQKAIEGIFAAITNIRAFAFGEPDAIVIHPTDWEMIRLGKDSNGQYFAGGPFTGAYGNGSFGANVYNLWGYPAVVTTAATQGKPLIGAFQQGGQVFTRKGLTIEMTNSNEDDFDTNLISIRAGVRKAFAVFRPSWFSTVTLTA